MKTQMIVGVLAGLLFAGVLRAQETPAPTSKQSIITFFKHLKESLTTSAVSGHRKKGRVGAVAAVRGANQKTTLADPNEPILKGDSRAKKEVSAAAEDAEFAAAVDLILRDKTDDGVKALEDFKAKHPKSRNLEKIQEAIDQAKALKAANAGGVQSPAPKAEPMKYEPAKNTK